MNVKKCYYYLFYRLYKWGEMAQFKWLSDWKASLVIDVLIAFILLSIGGYYTIITKKDMLPVHNPIQIIWLIMLSVGLFNYWVFHFKDKWKKYVKEFDKWPKKKNAIGNVIVILVIVGVIANLFFTFYLMSRINWKQYPGYHS